MRQFLIALDQMLNTVCKGWADETLSARAYRNAANGNAKWQRIRHAIDALFFWQPNHCKAAHRMELERMHLPPSYRKPPDQEIPG
jgi:hypothetical protein